MAGARDVNVSTGIFGLSARHNPQGVARLRIAVAIWLALLAGIFCSRGHYWGTALLAPAALHIWLAWRLRARVPGQH